MDGFLKFKWLIEAEKILQVLYRIDCYFFVSVSFIFSLNFSITLVIRSTKPTLTTGLFYPCGTEGKGGGGGVGSL